MPDSADKKLLKDNSPPKPYPSPRVWSPRGGWIATSPALTGYSGDFSLDDSILNRQAEFAAGRWRCPLCFDTSAAPGAVFREVGSRRRLR